MCRHCLKCQAMSSFMLGFGSNRPFQKQSDKLENSATSQQVTKFAK